MNNGSAGDHGFRPSAHVHVLSQNPLFGGLLVKNLRARGLSAELINLEHLEQVLENGPGDGCFLVDLEPYDFTSDGFYYRVVRRLGDWGARVAVLADESWRPRALRALPVDTVLPKSLDMTALMRAMLHLVGLLRVDLSRKSG